MQELHDLEPLKQFNLIYLASPYSKYPKGLERAYCKICRIAGRLLVNGVTVYSPIAHTHGIASHAYLDPYDYNIWLPFDGAMMRACDAMVVALMQEWQTSYGVAHEMDVFNEAHKPIFALDPMLVEERP